MHSRDLIEQYKTYVQDWRRYFHKHPELSNEEFETTKTLAKECRRRTWNGPHRYYSWRENRQSHCTSCGY